jgi:hypothetical protein
MASLQSGTYVLFTYHQIASFQPILICNSLLEPENLSNLLIEENQDGGKHNTSFFNFSKKNS